MATPIDPLGLVGFLSDANVQLRVAVAQGIALYTEPDPGQPKILSNPTPDLANDKADTPHAIYIIDVENQQYLRIQNVPLEFDYSPESTFAAINTIGRNNPFYHYTGSEDTLTFDISWYANEASRTDVIRSCRWLESYTKNDGYTDEPHRIKLAFGELFTNDLWLITAAPYKLSLFSKPNSMMPTLAYQTLTLKRVVETNRTKEEILHYPTIYVEDNNQQTDQEIKNIKWY